MPVIVKVANGSELYLIVVDEGLSIFFGQAFKFPLLELATDTICQNVASTTQALTHTPDDFSKDFLDRTKSRLKPESYFPNSHRTAQHHTHQYL
jgi:hypothetical protein